MAEEISTPKGPKVIASTYELGEEIGAGGGGTVYLGTHMRLGKPVVLKLDKRKLTTKPEVLRREVDALKNLSHTYIPQVYDFIAESDITIDRAAMGEGANLTVGGKTYVFAGGGEAALNADWIKVPCTAADSDADVAASLARVLSENGLPDAAADGNTVKFTNSDALPVLSEDPGLQVKDGVYTVMDYIEGESLDKPLKNGQRFEQRQIVEWACQLMEALVYLHSRPPHGILHSDIKPANIMLTPQGDIRLIDFNIALALGEDGAVRVGFSRGYASPEHYSVDYGDVGQRSEGGLPVTERVGTALESSGRSASTGGTPKPMVKLDVRSDVYSAGATLYHLLTGRRPHQDAEKVTPISDTECSPAVAAIIRKAMAPDPNERYQTAAEMLWAFEHLHEEDPRTKGHKRRCKVTAAVVAALFLAGGLMTFIGLRQMKQAEELARLAAEDAELQERLGKEALSAVRASERAYQAGDIPEAAAQAMAALQRETAYTPQAQKALTDALGVYDMTDGFKPRLALELDSAPLKLALSPEGTRVATLISGSVLAFDPETGEEIVRLPADSSALSDVVFSGENTLLYAGDGALKAYDLEAERELWSGRPATGIALSADGSTAAAVYRDETIVTIYNVATGAVQRVVDLPSGQRVAENDILLDPEDNLFALNSDGTQLAVSFANGGLSIFDLRDSQNDIEIFDQSEYFHFEGGFFGQYLAFSATNSTESVFAVIDVPAQEQTGGFSSEGHYRLQVDEFGLCVAYQNVLVRMDPVTGDQTELAYTNADIQSYFVGDGYTVVSTADGACSFFDADANLLETQVNVGSLNFLRIAGNHAAMASTDSPSLRVLNLEQHEEAEIFAYDPAYEHDEARVSDDGETVMLFSTKGFRLCRMDGTVIQEVSLPEPNQLYDQQYRREEGENFLDNIYYDGTTRRYSAKTGELVSETPGEAPDESLYEEFLTDHLKVTSPLHGAPEAYDRESGELVKTLEPDAYLTYVTQVGEYVMTEYISTQGERYGLLLDENCETIARLPGLCDILPDGRLIFDDYFGNLRQTHVYSLEELKTLADYLY